MWVVVHGLTGLTLGSFFPFPLWALALLALIIHAVLDLLPHWDYTGLELRAMYAALDLVWAIGAVLLLWGLLDLPVAGLVAAALSALPDLDVLDAILPLPRSGRLFPSHWASFPHGTASPAMGVPLQLVIASSCVVLLSVLGPS